MRSHGQKTAANTRYFFLPLTVNSPQKTNVSPKLILMYNVVRAEPTQIHCGTLPSRIGLNTMRTPAWRDSAKLQKNTLSPFHLVTSSHADRFDVIYLWDLCSQKRDRILFCCWQYFKKKGEKKRNILKSQLELFPCPSNHVTQSQIDYQMLELRDSFFIFPFSSIGEFRGDLKIW